MSACDRGRCGLMFRRRMRAIPLSHDSSRWRTLANGLAMGSPADARVRMRRLVRACGEKLVAHCLRFRAQSYLGTAGRRTGDARVALVSADAPVIACGCPAVPWRPHLFRRQKQTGIVVALGIPADSTGKHYDSEQGCVHDRRRHLCDSYDQLEISSACRRPGFVAARQPLRWARRAGPGTGYVVYSPSLPLAVACELAFG